MLKKKIQLAIILIVGIPLTVQSARPSSRSSLRSSGSIGSFSGGGNHRRPSSAPLHSGSSLGSKGVLVSTSRSGAARSAAILLISCHISAINSNKSNQKQFNSEDNVSGNIFIDESMSKYLRKQLNQQKQMLHLELPSQSKKIIKLLELNGNLPRINQNYNDDDDDEDIDGNCSGIMKQHGDATGIYYENDGIIEMGALPTPASETAKVVVKHFDTNIIQNFLKHQNTHTLI